MPRFRVYREDEDEVQSDLSLVHSRVIHSNSHRIDIDQPTSRIIEPAHSNPLEINPFIAPGELVGEPVEDIVICEPQTKKSKPDRALKEWSGSDRDGLGYREEYLYELLRAESLSSVISADGNCVCGSAAATYLCRDCHPHRATCRECCLETHKTHPFHVIHIWNGQHFQKTSLSALGHRIQLGYHAEGHCPLPKPAHREFAVIHTNGIHHVLLDFCGCIGSPAHRRQLLRAGLFPATVQKPKTAVSFPALKQFHSLTLTGKLSAYDYCRSVERLTDNTGIVTVKWRYKPFLRVVRKYRNLFLLKHAGRGNIPDGIRSTQAGDLALKCLACPIPGINVEPDWRLSTPRPRWFLFMPILALDACFRLKNLFRSNDITDPGLHTGKAYFVGNEDYKVHYAKYASQKDVSTCSGFRTLAQAETRDTTGLRTSGVGMCVCARHEMILPCGVGDLQKGERYCNMDFIAMSASRPFAPLETIMWSYDISCQWKINLRERMAAVPLVFQHMFSTKFRFTIPKCHCPSHILGCQPSHSLNLVPGVGRTDGEGIERGWSELNGVANSTKEMGPGSRHDTLDDHMGHHNWRKTVSLGSLLKKRLTYALEQYALQLKLHTELTESLPSEKVADWSKTVEKWEDEMSQDWKAGLGEDNPYLSIQKHPTLAAVKQQLLEEERLAAKNAGSPLGRSTPTTFLDLALLVEDLQRRIKYSASQIKDEASTTAAGDIQKKRVHAQRHLIRMRNMQPRYIPLITDKLLDADTDKAGDVEDEKLWLPSELSSSERQSGCVAGLAQKEDSLRVAQCQDALERIRNLERAKFACVAYRNRNVRGQGQNTRMQQTFSEIKDKIELAAAKYRRSRLALLSLRGDGDWAKVFKVLNSSDLRGPSETEMDIGLEKRKRKKRKIETHHREGGLQVGEGTRTISWIWCVPGVLNGQAADEGREAAIKVEWLKGRARVMRWREEIELVKEEQRRTLVSLQSRADWWVGHQVISTSDGATNDGIRAYALRQAALYQNLKHSFTQIWSRSAGSTPSAASQSSSLQSSTPAAVEPEDIDEDDESDHEEPLDRVIEV